VLPAESIAPLAPGELAALPVFPLPRAVLFPGASVGLHLFEPRYRAMMRHCLDRGPRAMALAHLRPGYEADYEGTPPIHAIAGAGRIVTHRSNPDGTFDLVLAGVARVRLVELAFEPPFRRARAEPIEDVVADPAHVGSLRTALVRDAAFVISALEGDAAMAAALRDPAASAGRFADRLLHVLVVDPDERQRLLETADVATRLDALAGVLAAVRARSLGRDRLN
jgi:Lon protease-like protein